MKVRSGFVSNSSSSSFVIAIRKQEPCECCGRTDPDFLEAVTAAGNYDADSEVCADTREEVLDYLKEAVEDDSDGAVSLDADPDQLDEGYWCVASLRAYQEIKAGKWDDWDLARVRISYHNPTLDHILHQGQKGGSIEVLVGDD